MGQEHDLAALPEPESLIPIDGQRRDVVQRGLDGNQFGFQRVSIADFLAHG